MACCRFSFYSTGERPGKNSDSRLPRVTDWGAVEIMNSAHYNQALGPVRAFGRGAEMQTKCNYRECDGLHRRFQGRSAYIQCFPAGLLPRFLLQPWFQPPKNEQPPSPQCKSAPPKMSQELARAFPYERLPDKGISSSNELHFASGKGNFLTKAHLINAFPSINLIQHIQYSGKGMSL